MPTSNIPTTLPGIERLIQRIQVAERGQQKELRISIQEARELTSELAILTSRLGQTVNEVHQALNELRQSTSEIDVKFDGGGF